MTDIEFSGVGTRIAQYRKERGLNGDELARRAGNGVTRAVLANIETGRKKDLSIVHLTAVAVALGVPPVALLWDVKQPESSTTIPDEGVHRDEKESDGETFMPAWRAMAWFGGKATGGDASTRDGADIDAYFDTFYLIRMVDELMFDTRQRERDLEELKTLEVAEAAGRLEKKDIAKLTFLRSTLSEMESSITELRAHLTELGVELEPWAP
jgi:transcriptional regulator with XRE-family HTH domain